MKSALVLDQQAGVRTIHELPEDYQPKVEMRLNASGGVEWWYPKGTMFEGDHAIHLCKTGQAAPLDQECADACGMTAVQLKRAQIEYEMDTKGISSKNDRELYAAGVIAVNAGGEIVPGPNRKTYDALREKQANKGGESA